MGLEMEDEDLKKQAECSCKGEVFQLEGSSESWNDLVLMRGDSFVAVSQLWWRFTLDLIT